MSQPLIDKIEHHLQEAFQSLGLETSLGRVVSSSQEGYHFQCNGAFKGAKIKGCSPLTLAQDLQQRLSSLETFADISISVPGFINIIVHDACLAEYGNLIFQDKRLGIPFNDVKQKLIVDFGGINIAKAMHVGHLRSSIIGESLQRIARFLGDEVVSDIHLGDWGLPIGMLIEEFRLAYPEWPYFKDNFDKDLFKKSPVKIEQLETLYPQAATRCKEEEARDIARKATADLQSGHPGYRALWQHFRQVSVEDIKRQFKPLDINFDLWLGESSVNDIISPLLEKFKQQNIAKESDGAIIIEVAKEEDKKPMPPLILVTSDNSITYGMTDLATIAQRSEEFNPKYILYVVDNRQSLHFEQVFRAAQRTKINQDAHLEHIAFGTLNGTDGKPFKTRSGGVMKLQDLLEAAIKKAQERLDEAELGKDISSQEQQEIAQLVAVAAIKFSDLSIPRLSDYIFDLDKFVSFQGKTGPYLLYTAVRIKSLLAKAKEQGLIPGTITIETEKQRDIILSVVQLSRILKISYEERAPHHLCEYAYTLAQKFSTFYQTCPILSNPNVTQAASWLALAKLTLQNLEQVLFLLGIKIPERM
ncbi:MAG: arginine--tRNA ligase [Caedibacter sp. 37-49]|nr:MAG: arginine--tRNA ligase [Caedibacter sp. 37-49]